LYNKYHRPLNVCGMKNTGRALRKCVLILVGNSLLNYCAGVVGEGGGGEICAYVLVWCSTTNTHIFLANKLHFFVNEFAAKKVTRLVEKTYALPSEWTIIFKVCFWVHKMDLVVRLFFLVLNLN
jgi:hypothetical protein